MAKIDTLQIGNKVFYLKHGLMNCSVHGSVSVNDKGISSGYTSTNNYILTTISSDSLKTNNWELQLRFRKTSDYTSSSSMILMSTSATGYVPIELGIDLSKYIYLSTYSTNGSSGLTNRLYADKDALVKNVWYTLKLQFTDLRITAQVYGDDVLLHEYNTGYTGALNMYSSSSSKLIFGADVDYDKHLPGKDFQLDLANSYFKLNKKYVFYAE